MLLINLWLMRRSFAPLSELARTMRRVYPLSPDPPIRWVEALQTGRRVR